MSDPVLPKVPMQHPVSGRAPANIYTSPAFLDVIADVYFPGQAACARDYAVAGQTFRLLTVPGRGPVTQQTFIDLHEPLPGPAGSPDEKRLPGLRRLEGVGGPPIPLAEHAQRLLRLEHRHELGAPSLQWSDFASWDEYLALLKTRRVLAEDLRRGRRLRGLVGDTQFCQDDTAADVLPVCMAWKSARDQQAQRPDLFAVEANQRFFLELRARGLLQASTLRADGRLLSIWLGTVHGGRWSGWIFAFNPDPNLSKYSLGRQLLYPMLESSLKAGHREFDFSIGLEPYKFDFATHVRPIAPLGAAPARERLALAGRQLLGRHPWWAEQARAVKGWLHASRR